MRLAAGAFNNIHVPAGCAMASLRPGSRGTGAHTAGVL